MVKQKILIADKMYSQLTEYIKDNQISRIFLVCDSSWPYLMIKNYFQSIEKDLKIAVVCFSDFSSNPLYESVVSGINLFCQGEYDLIAAVGGGSSKWIVCSR